LVYFNYSSKHVNKQIIYFYVLPEVSEIFVVVFFLREKEDTELQVIISWHVQKNHIKCEVTQLTVLYMEYAAKTWNKDCCLEK